MTIRIKAGADVQNVQTGKWGKVKQEITLPIVSERYGIYTVRIMDKFYKLDYKQFEVVEES